MTAPLQITAADVITTSQGVLMKLDTNAGTVVLITLGEAEIICDSLRFHEMNKRGEIENERNGQ